MLYNRPPTGSGQIPGYTTAPTNRQSIPSFSAMGDPALSTSPSAVTPVNQLPSPQTSSSFSTPSSGNFASSNSPAPNNLTGTQPLGGGSMGSNNMLTGSPPTSGGQRGGLGASPPSGANMSPAPPTNEGTMPSMASYFNSSNPSTLMRTMVGNTTQSGAAY